MSAKWPIIFRDPIHNLIPFHNTDWDRLLLQLIDCKEVQRLRRIKQLGFSELVFPGANHNRFAHSLGVLHVAKKFLDQFDRVSGTPLTKEQRTFILVASLLHDIGHGPFSHAFEKVTGTKHEKLTRDIIKDPDTEVHQVLAGHDKKMPDDLGNFFFTDEGDDGPPLPLDIPPYLTEVVSSQMDADRADYLLRDSHATGTDYGNYDLEWLVSHLYPQQDGKRFFLSRKALSAAEAYVFARFHMYRTVYFHKTTRAAEVMLRLIFRRVKELLGDKTSAKAVAKIAPGMPVNVTAAFTGQMSLQQYLTLDEHAITEFMKACAGSPDKILANMSNGLLNRRLFKAIDLTGCPIGDIAAFSSAVQLSLKNEPAAAYSFADDSPSDTPYKPYDIDAEKPASQIFVEDVSGKPREISSLSTTVEQLRKGYELSRFYFPESFRETISRIAKEKLRKVK